LDRALISSPSHASRLKLAPVQLKEMHDAMMP
jgi:hypothetical protein